MKRLLFLFLSTTLTLVLSETSLQEFVNGNNLFTSTIYKEILKEEFKNFLVSPFSAEVILALAQSGCKGDTAKEIRNALQLPDDGKKIESGVKASLSLFTGSGVYTLRTANKMYVKEDFTLNEDFKNSAIEIYGADIEQIDFVKSQEAVYTINQWVEQKTNNKIQNLINPEMLDPYTRLLLINALYFKGNWSTRFSSTEKRKFYKTIKDVQEVDTMQQYKKWYNYYESSELDAKFLELPFEGGDVSMVIVLPNEKEGLSTLESQIDKAFALQNLKSEFVNVFLPKFRVETSIDFDGILKKLGVKSAFNETLADLSGIAGKPGDLIIDKVVQKTFIEVEENGVEAAAATYVLVPTAILEEIPIYEPKPKDFIVDHPFIFYIKAKNFIVFAGRVLEPSI